MQNLVVIAIVLLAPSVVFAGTRRAQPGEEQRALSIWAKHCANGREGGNENGIYIHCKHPLGSETYQLTQTLQSNVESKQREQYIFVQPPSLHFDHSLRVNGGSALEPKTIVYVQPARTSHSYTADLQVKDSDHKKPELVFLTGSHGGSEVEIDSVKIQPTPTSSPVATGGHGGHVIVSKS